MKKIYYIFIIIFFSLFVKADEIDSLKQIILKTTNDTLKIESLNKIADIYIDINKDTAIIFSNKALILSKEKRIIETEIESYRELGIINIYKGEFTQAIKLLNTALEKSIAANTKEKTADIHYLLGICFYNINEYDKAIQQYNKALHIAKYNNYNNVKMNCYNAIGVINKAIGNYDKAIEYYFKSLKLAEEQNDQEAISNAYNNIGIIYKIQKLYDEAIEFYKKAYVIDSINNNKYNLMQINQNLGVIYKIKGDYNKALDYYQKSLSIANEINSKIGKAKAYIHLSILLQKQKKYFEAIKGLQQAMKYQKAIGNRSGLVNIYVNLGHIYLSLYDSLRNQTYIQKALTNSIKAYKLSKEIMVKEDLKSSSALLKEIYTRLGDYKKALKYADFYIKLNQDLYNDNKLKVIESLKRKYENEKKQILIEKLKKEQYLRNQKIKTQQLQEIIRKRQVFVLTISLILLVIFFIYILYNLKKNKKLTKDLQKLNIELNNKSEELKEQYLQSVKQNIEIKIKAKEIEQQKESIIQQQKKLQAIDEDYKQIIDANTDIIFIINEEGKILFLNKRINTLLGFSLNELVGRNFIDFIHESAKEEYIKYLHQIFINLNSINFESYMKRKDDMLIPVEVSAQIIKYKEQDVITGTVRDITERKIAEQELKEKTKKYELITEAIEDLIWMVDFNMQFLYVSPSSVKTIGYTFEEIIKLSNYHLFTNESLKILRRKIAEARVNYNKVSSQIYFINKKGENIKSVTTGHIVIENNKEIGFIAVSRFDNL